MTVSFFLAIPLTYSDRHNPVDLRAALRRLNLDEDVQMSGLATHEKLPIDTFLGHLARQGYIERTAVGEPSKKGKGAKNSASTAATATASATDVSATAIATSTSVADTAAATATAATSVAATDSVAAASTAVAASTDAATSTDDASDDDAAAPTAAAELGIRAFVSVFVPPLRARAELTVYLLLVGRISHGPPRSGRASRR